MLGWVRMNLVQAFWQTTDTISSCVTWIFFFPLTNLNKKQMLVKTTVLPVKPVILISIHSVRTFVGLFKPIKHDYEVL